MGEKKSGLSALSVHMKSVAEHVFFHEVAINNKVFKKFIKF